MTAASFKIGSFNYGKQDGKNQFSSQLFNSIHDILNGKYEEGRGTEMINKIGLEGSIGDIAGGGTVGLSQNVYFSGGYNDSKSFVETTVKDDANGLMSALTQESKYGRVYNRKMQTGYTFEFKLIFGVDIKVFSEKILKKMN